MQHDTRSPRHTEVLDIPYLSLQEFGPDAWVHRLVTAPDVLVRTRPLDADGSVTPLAVCLPAPNK